jgi:hypothetical protein
LLSASSALFRLNGGNLTMQAVLLRLGGALSSIHQLLQLNPFFCLLGANLLGPLVQASLVLLKRDPNNIIATDNLSAELGLACACLTVLGRSRNRCRKHQGADERSQL